MKLKTLFNSLSCLFIPGITATDNGVMITGDGSVIMEKLGKISTGILFTMITTFGMRNNAYSSIAQASLTIDDLFQP